MMKKEKTGRKKKEEKDDELILGTSQGHCVQCGSKSKYRCPNCQALTCSASCYKVHNESCVEDFYKQQVFTHLKTEGKRKDKEDQKKVREVLQRSHQQQSQQLDMIDSFSQLDVDSSTSTTVIDNRIVEEIEISDDEDDEEGKDGKEKKKKKKLRIKRKTK